MKNSDTIDLSWMVQSKCKELGTEYFFPTDDDEWLDIDLAKSTCKLCPVREQCLDWAIYIKDDEGVWGGIEGEKRRKLRYKLNKTFDAYIADYMDDIRFIAHYGE
jgi:WhiB family transcriptional regulator, redox-sensing transcriptional regulator